MSISERFKKVAMMAALGASLMMPDAQAKDTNTETKAPDRIEQSVKAGWTWGSDRASLRDKAAYESLPKEYKAFAGKSFMERFEMREEWEQKDFLKRDRKRTVLLKKNPEATIGDYAPRAALPDLKLADYPAAEGSYWTKIILDQMDGKLSPIQARVAEQMVTLGRPLATIDPSLSYADQLKACGFDVEASVVEGTRFSSLSARDQSIFVAQDQDAEALNNRNEEGRRNLRIQLYKERDEEWEATHGWLDRLFPEKTVLLSEEETKGMFPRETINGKSVGIRQPNEVTYSIHDEVTRKVAEKIEREEQLAAQQAKEAKFSR